MVCPGFDFRQNGWNWRWCRKKIFEVTIFFFLRVGREDGIVLVLEVEFIERQIGNESVGAKRALSSTSYTSGRRINYILIVIADVKSSARKTVSYRIAHLFFRPDLAAGRGFKTALRES